MIEHLSQYISYIEQINQRSISSKFIYRGENDEKYMLLPSVYRRLNESGMNASIYLTEYSEKYIIQQFIAEASIHAGVPPTDDYFTWLEYAQHYGVPTRLLDWTSNPLVALFFACYRPNEKNGKINILHYSSYKEVSEKKNRNYLKEKSLKQSVVDMIWNGSKEFPYPLVFHPYYLDRRMSAQSSLFMVWGNRVQTLNEMVAEIENDGRGHELRLVKTNDEESLVCEETSALEVITIPADAKAQLLRELDNVGINYGTLFPGLDGIGKTVEWRMNIQNNQQFMKL